MEMEPKIFPAVCRLVLGSHRVEALTTWTLRRPVANDKLVLDQVPPRRTWRPSWAALLMAEMKFYGSIPGRTSGRPARSWARKT
jgi:hypothetical protein